MNKKSYLQKLAREGNSVAQNQLGQMYFWGQSDVGINQSYKMAIRWYRLSAAQGNDNALYSLGWAYKFGEGVSQNYEMALKYFKRAAVRGHEQAMYEVGTYYYENKDHKKAAIWFKMSLESGWRNRTPLELKTWNMKERESVGPKRPNKLTMKTLEKGARNEDVYSAKDTDDLFKHLGI